MIFHCLHTEALACAAESSTKLTIEKEVSGAVTKCIPSNEIQSPWEQLFYRCGRGERKATLVSSPWEVELSNSSTSLLCRVPWPHTCLLCWEWEQDKPGAERPRGSGLCPTAIKPECFQSSFPQRCVLLLLILQVLPQQGQTLKLKSASPAHWTEEKIVA